MANSITDYLLQMQELTKKNLELLKALNDSFYTKSEHLSVKIDDTTYVIPSFLSLENKINTLQDNFENLVNAPKSGDACFNFNGNTQEIQVKGFSNTPFKAFDGIDMTQYADSISFFGKTKNEIFKDFLTPTPFVKFDLSNIPDDIQTVNLKKIAVKNSSLVSILKTLCGFEDTTVCKPISYSDFVKKSYTFVSGTDYIEYDKTVTLPLRYKLGSGKYSIISIENNWTDNNFTEHYKLVLDNLSYYIADETIQRTLNVGDHLVTNDDRCKLEIEEIYNSTNTIVVAVENGAYVDLVTADSGNDKLSTLRYFSADDIEQYKYINVPLEEDEFVLAFVAPIQRNSLIQSAWGTGLFFDTYKLIYDEDTTKTFKEYYDTFVTNVGDKLFGVVDMLYDDLVNTTKSEYDLLRTKPVIDTDKLHVTLINKHMSNSETVSEIYDLYKQKKEAQLELSNVQKNIDNLNSLLSSVSFEDTTNNRSIYTDQISSLSERKNELIDSITNIIQQITTASTDTDTPVENPKYHIRGFFDYAKYLEDNDIEGKDIIKIDVQYRYKNANKAVGNAESFQDAIFSDWCIMDSFVSQKEPEYNQVKFNYNFPADTTDKNVPSFNQIDIPISQGETVDIKLRVVYSTGYPFVKVTSEWSDIINIEFPDELKKNVTVLDIIEENNNDVLKNQFTNILQTKGVNSHVEDKLVDQDKTYYHQPEHIASGFYTSERRVIPLYDQLQTMQTKLTALEDEIAGTNSENIEVTINDDINSIVVNPEASNKFIVTSYTEAEKEDNVASVVLTLNIANTSSHTVKLYSMFPGDYTQPVLKDTTSRFTAEDYCSAESINGTGNRVWIKFDDITGISQIGDTEYLHPQHMNQWLYFRLNNPFSNTSYYNNVDCRTTSNKLYGGVISGEGAEVLTAISNSAVMYPSVSSLDSICNTGNKNYILLNSGESLQIPIVFKYYLSSTTSTIEKTMSFDIRTSLYLDPMNYTFTVQANNEATLAQKQLKKVNKNRYKTIVRN